MGDGKQRADASRLPFTHLSSVTMYEKIRVHAVPPRKKRGKDTGPFPIRLLPCQPARPVCDQARAAFA